MRNMYYFATEFEFSNLKLETELLAENDMQYLYNYQGDYVLVMKDLIGPLNALHGLYSVDYLDFDRVIQVGSIGAFEEIAIGSVIMASATVMIDSNIEGKFAKEMDIYLETLDEEGFVIGTSSNLGLPPSHLNKCIQYGVMAKDMEAAAVNSFCYMTGRIYRMIKMVTDHISSEGDINWMQNYIDNAGSLRKIIVEH